jgi:hypothetical protein
MDTQESKSLDWRGKSATWVLALDAVSHFREPHMPSPSRLSSPARPAGRSTHESALAAALIYADVTQRIDGAGLQCLALLDQQARCPDALDRA